MQRLYRPATAIGAQQSIRSRLRLGALTGLAFAGVTLLVLALQTWHYAGRNYRDDELRTVHAGLTMTIPEVVRWMSVDIHPPLWRVTATTWVALFGPDEAVTRFLSTLYTALALAVFFRLARDLFDDAVALGAVFLLGIHALFLFYSHEFRPYPAVLLWTNALHLLFLRWLRRPSLRYALLFVLAAAAALYTHFFALYVLAAQGIAFLLLVRFQPLRYARAFALFGLAGLSFAGWFPSFLHSFLVTRPGGIDYGIAPEMRTPQVLYVLLQARPLGVGNFLHGLGLLLPVRGLIARPTPDSDAPIFRFGPGWRKWYFAVVATVILGGAFLTAEWVDVLTRRNLVVVLPPLALLAALGLRALPWQAALLAALLLLLPPAREFVDYEAVEPYRQVVEAIRPRYAARDPIILSVDNGTGAYFAFAYSLMDRMSGQVTQDDMLYLTLGEPRVNLPEPMRRIVVDDDPASLAVFADLVAGADQVWWVTSGLEPPHAAAFRRRLEADFERVDSTAIEPPGRDTTYRVDLYRRATG